MPLDTSDFELGATTRQDSCGSRRTSSRSEYVGGERLGPATQGANKKDVLRVINTHKCWWIGNVCTNSFVPPAAGGGAGRK